MNKVSTLSKFGPAAELSASLLVSNCFLTVNPSFISLAALVSPTAKLYNMPNKNIRSLPYKPNKKHEKLDN